MKIDLACGVRKKPGFFGVDFVAHPGVVDLVWNLEKFPWPFGDEIADEVYCSHYLEHVPDFFSFFNECYRIMKMGATMEIFAPYWTSMRAWQDPTHVRAISENTFFYVDKDSLNWAGLEQYPLKASFSCWYEFIMNDAWNDPARTQEELAFAKKYNVNVIDDIHAILTKKAMPHG